MKTALLCGSFDPIHDGHIYLIRAALEVEAVDRVLVVVCGNPNKKNNYSLNLEKASSLAAWNLSIEGFSSNQVRVITSSHSMVNICLDFGCDVIIRGYRTEKEKTQEEFQFYLVEDLLPANTRLLLFKSPLDLQHVSSTKIKEDIREFIEPRGVSVGTTAVMDKILNNRTVIAVVGTPGIGKTQLCQRISKGSPVHYDAVVAVYSAFTSQTPGAAKLRREVKDITGKDPKNIKEFNTLLIDPHLYLLIAGALRPYVLQDWRRFSKKTLSDLVLFELHSIESINKSRNFIIVVGKGKQAAITAEQASIKKTRDSFGKVIQFKVDKDDPKYRDKAAVLITKIREIIQEGEDYEKVWHCPSHEEAWNNLWEDWKNE